MSEQQSAGLPEGALAQMQRMHDSALDRLAAATRRAEDAETDRDDYFNESMGAFAERDGARRARDEALARAEAAERERDAANQDRDRLRQRTHEIQAEESKRHAELQSYRDYWLARSKAFREWCAENATAENGPPEGILLPSGHRLNPENRIPLPMWMSASNYEWAVLVTERCYQAEQERDIIRARTLAEVGRAWDALTPEFEDLIAEGRAISKEEE